MLITMFTCKYYYTYLVFRMVVQQELLGMHLVIMKKIRYIIYGTAQMQLHCRAQVSSKVLRKLVKVTAINCASA